MVLRGYWQARWWDGLAPLACTLSGYSAWHEACVAPLVWLGLTDPVAECQAGLLADDPIEGERAALARAWWRAFGQCEGLSGTNLAHICREGSFAAGIGDEAGEPANGGQDAAGSADDAEDEAGWMPPVRDRAALDEMQEQLRTICGGGADRGPVTARGAGGALGRLKDVIAGGYQFRKVRPVDTSKPTRWTVIPAQAERPFMAA
jgi:hypothetical protein